MLHAVADLGVKPGGLSPPSLFWVKKEKPVGQAKQNLPHLAQGMDPPLTW